MAITDVTAAAAPDLNGDSFIDLVLARRVADQVDLWLMDVDREWVPNRPDALDIPLPMALAAADVSGDGHLDLVVGSALGGTRPAQLWVVNQRP